MAVAKAEQQDVIKVEGGRLIVDVALGKGARSASGKSVVVFSTHGNVKLDDGHVVGINCYRKA